MNIILSIHPKWAEKIYSGENSIEWRKSEPKKAVKNAVIFLYETAPVRKVTGCVKFNGAIARDFIGWPENLREWLVRAGQVNKADILKYQGKSKYVYSWHVYGPRKFDTPKSLEEFGLKRPPQSWCYTEVDV